jgi:hypothetical protein
MRYAVGAKLFLPLVFGSTTDRVVDTAAADEPMPDEPPASGADQAEEGPVRR